MDTLLLSTKTYHQSPLPVPSHGGDSEVSRGFVAHCTTIIQKDMGQQNSAAGEAGSLFWPERFETEQVCLSPANSPRAGKAAPRITIIAHAF
ncbi:hypothetical protein JZ751_001460 [Albula glossodonta]|uniref:Uncharacterized protein n=1 Tax=Albula glossodonta TaxID=121402 RepID=A0A8T2PTJ4_9TELE|nr:hypothetical protein JZ751_001460 [Albula glossodonta]